MAAPQEYTSRDRLNQLLNQIVSSVDGFAQEQLAHIKSLTKIGISLSVENDLNKIFDLILEEALSYTKAEGATIYSISPDRRSLDFQIVYNSVLKLRMGGTYDPVSWPPLPMYNPDDSPRLTHLATFVAHTGQPQKVDDVYDQSIFDNSGTKAHDTKTGYRTRSVLAIPLKDHEQEVLGVIQLINATHPELGVVAFSEDHMTMLMSLASIAAIILTNKKLIEGLENLLMQFIESVAHAIDRKSKYTHGHITRVAELTEWIAQAVQATDLGPFGDINFSFNEMREISISGWMHDVGKIVTPPHIMDKSTKLEALTDRIELVEARFQRVIAEIGKDIIRAEYAHDSKRIRELQGLVDSLRDDLEFCRVSNIGGEFLDDARLKRLESISKFRYECDGDSLFLITDEECKNLSIRRGTLLGSELDIMREHAQITYEMLSQLTFPKKFKNVPLFASSHHEKLNGGGYPLNLNASNLPLQARIIGIADLFEALTAADRPYNKTKEPRAVSEALKMMGEMARNGEIDKDLLDLFIDDRLFEKYGEKFLYPSQMTDFDPAAIKGIYREPGMKG